MSCLPKYKETRMFEIKRTRINQTNQQLNEQTIYLKKKEGESTMINRDSKKMEE